jgi:hypothetical protein
MDLDQVAEDEMYLDAIISKPRTFGNWEWHHGSPQADPQNYKDNAHVLMTYPFNRMYTVNNPKAFDYFRNKGGLAVIRHFPLNENTLDDITGYFVSDFERVGPYVMMPEALAVANGDPWYIGYTSGHVFNRGFPEYSRAFNANFLALPALPSEVVENASDNQNVVVRMIPTPGYQGTYFAVVNTGFQSLKGVAVNLGKGGQIEAAVTGQTVGRGPSVTLDLDPFELKSLVLR